MLPLQLLQKAQNHPMLVELKNGETYNGHLVGCDSWMNIHLREVICTSRDGDRFWKMNEVYIRGINIKYLRIPDEVIDQVRDDEVRQERNRNRNQKYDGKQRQVLDRSSATSSSGRGGHRGGRGGGGRGNFRGNRGARN